MAGILKKFKNFMLGVELNVILTSCNNFYVKETKMGDDGVKKLVCNGKLGCNT